MPGRYSTPNNLSGFSPDGSHDDIAAKIIEISRAEGIDSVVFYTILGNDYYNKTATLSCRKGENPLTQAIGKYFDGKSVISKQQYVELREIHSPFSDMERIAGVLGKDGAAEALPLSSISSALINVQKNISFGFILVVFSESPVNFKLSGNLLSLLLDYHQHVTNIKLIEINKVFFDSFQSPSIIPADEEEGSVNIIISWVMELIKRILNYDYGVVGIIDDNKKIFEVVNLFGFDKDLNKWFRSVAPQKYVQLKKWVGTDDDEPMKLINPEVFKPPIYNADVKHFLVLKLTNDEYGRIGILILASKRFSHFELVKENKTLGYLISSLSSILKYIFSSHYSKGAEDNNAASPSKRAYRAEEADATLSLNQAIKTSATKMKALYQTADKIKNGLGNVLITGETGVGKGYLAEYIHFTSNRKDKPFVTIDCASIPEHLLESELFGHKKGAFTGAIMNKVGKLEEGDKGTIFLDEIGEMGLELQKKLLKFLDTRKICPIGSNTPVDVDVRIVAATNKDLKEEVEKGGFRKDLYHRINIFTLFIPPLRERRDEIPLLSLHILGRLNKLYNMNIVDIKKSAMDKLIDYAWPGNVRELFNLIEKSYFLHATEKSIVDIDIPAADGSIKEDAAPEKERAASDKETAAADDGPAGDTLETARQRQQRMEFEQIDGVLTRTFGNISVAAKLLDINRKTLFLKMRRYGLKKEAYKNR